MNIKSEDKSLRFINSFVIHLTLFDTREIKRIAMFGWGEFKNT